MGTENLDDQLMRVEKVLAGFRRSKSSIGRPPPITVLRL